MKYPFFESRIDCLYINRYYQINDNTFDMIKIFKPTINGLIQLNERKNTMDLKAKLATKKGNGIDINASNGNQSLSARLQANKSNGIANKSVMNKADLTANKFAEVENLRQTIKQQSIDIINMQTDIKDLCKVIIENNAFIGTIAKDQKSILNAINTLHGKLASNKIESNASKPITDNKVINRKAIDNDNIISIASQNLDNDSYLALYEHFKGYFNHKFAKSNQCNKLNEFKFFINGIDFASLQSIDDSARAIWQAYRSDNGNMLFAPNSMKLAIKSLIKLGNDFDLIKDNDIKSSDNIKVNSEVKDFKYWANLLQVDISIIKECIDILKTDNIKDDTTKSLLIEYLQENSNEYTMQDINEFISYLESTNFAG
jgi:hypothetical protein